MIHFLCFENLFLRFNNIWAISIQSVQNPFRKCHYQTNPPSSLVEYLQTSLGVSTERALTLSQQLILRKARNPESVITSFKSQGFSETHIESIVKRAPLLLAYSSPESSLRPKIRFLKDKGISVSDLADLMVSHPSLFKRGLEGHIKPVFNVLRSILGTDESVVRFLIRSKLIFNPDILSANMTILRNCGVQNHLIFNLVVKWPRALMAKSDRFNEVVEMVKGMGFELKSYSFVRAVLTILGLSRHAWDAKVKVYTSLGWSAEEVLSLFCKQPSCMSISVEKIRKGFDYLTKELGWGPSYISKYPVILLLSLEKRVIPRHRFLQFLASKGFIKTDKMPANIFRISEKKFLKNFVIKHESEDPDILKTYESLMGSKLLNIRDGEDCNVQ